MCYTLSKAVKRYLSILMQYIILYHIFAFVKGLFLFFSALGGYFFALFSPGGLPRLFSFLKLSLSPQNKMSGRLAFPVSRFLYRRMFFHLSSSVPPQAQGSSSQIIWKVYESSSRRTSSEIFS